MKHHSVVSDPQAQPGVVNQAPQDPKTLVTQMLAAAGHPNPSAWEAQLSDMYDTAPSVGHQVFLVNRCWRLIVGDVPGTSDARYCLVDTPRIADWQRSFEQGIVPCAVKHNLPLTTNSTSSK